MRPGTPTAHPGILFTDLYQLTMAQVYFRAGIHEQPALFDHFFRSYPDYGGHQAGYCISAGLAWLLAWLEQARFGESELSYLRSLQGRAGEGLFGEDFLTWLKQDGNFSSLEITAVAEGRVVHPNTPITVVRGPLAMAQLLETALLNYLNYQTLIATKAARIHQAGRGHMLLEFGMRRGPDEGVTAGARAALIGGADFSSNVEASRLLGFPPKGTHAHSMVQAFIALGGNELEAFQAYADAYPDDCLLLVDTIDTLNSGLPNAIKVFQGLKRRGHQPMGIRLDSGDLAFLSIQATRMLVEAGFEEAAIVLSNELDELSLLQILTQIEEEAPHYGLEPETVIRRLIYGVGTRLITSQGDAALDGVYKLVAIEANHAWQPAIKLSEVSVKIPNPGSKRLWRIYDRRRRATADLITLADEDPRQMASLELHHPSNPAAYRTLAAGDIEHIEPLLELQWDQGRAIQPPSDIEQMRQRRIHDIERLDPGVRRLINPHIYHVSLSEKLWRSKNDLVDSMKGQPLSS
jgi:nicotinate phosphoribosyltransferase